MMDTAKLRKLAKGAEKNQYAIGASVLYECADEIDRLRNELSVAERALDGYRDEYSEGEPEDRGKRG